MAQVETQAAQAEGFYPLAHFIKHPQHYPWVVHLMKYDDGLVKATANALADMGFRKFRFLGAGGLSLVLDTTENQVVRISARDMVGDNGLRPRHPAILQPIFRKRMSHGLPLPGDRHTLILEVLPKVRTEGVTQQHAAQVEDALRKSGYEVEDMFAIDNVGRKIRDESGHAIYRTCNIGLIDIDGKSVPVLIDPGLIRRCRRTARNDEHLKPWLDDKGRWLQQVFEDRTAPTNVIDKEALRKVEHVLRGKKPLLARLGLKADTRRQSELVNAITNDGMYGDEVATLLQRAHERDPHNPDFSRVLREERQRMKEEGHQPAAGREP
ncbi:MAG: hypothetical protein EBX37_08850 [Alphaproteobacteria bacterium]|nr:hypothetical protein [Alphaproteobacteria bacterium]